MGNSKYRHKRRNYLPKKGLQWRLIGKVVTMVVLAMSISIGVTCLLYYDLSNVEFKGDVPFYYVTEDVSDNPENVPTALDILLPGLLISGAIMVVITITVGIFASHKVAGAIFHLQKSVKEIGDGKFNMPVRLRKKDEFHDLASDINQTVSNISAKLKQLKTGLRKIKSNASNMSASTEKDTLIKSVDETANTLDYFNIN